LLAQEAYHEVLKRRQRWLESVPKLVGGVIEGTGPDGAAPAFSRVDRTEQKAAVRFLNDYAFATPARLLDPRVVNRLRPAGVVTDLADQGRAILRSLFQPGRFDRLADAELIAPDKAYPIGELLADVQAGLWAELHHASPRIDPLRRELQATYLELLGVELETDGRRPPGRHDLRAAALAALAGLRAEITKALSKTSHPATRAHLTDSCRTIGAMLQGDKKETRAERVGGAHRASKDPHH
jgi:hypothetical protein